MALGLTTERLPELRDPALVVAFAGWTDAGEAASAAVRWLVRRLPGQRIGSIDAEHYHVFTSSRPTVRLVGGERRITWPIHDFYVHTDPAKPRDLALAQHHRFGEHAVDVESHHPHRSASACRHDPGSGRATRQLRIRARGASGRAAGAAR